MDTKRISGIVTFGILLVATVVLYNMFITSDQPITGNAASIIAACTNQKYCGDLNCDGYTEVLDAQRVAQHGGQMIILRDLDRADVDNNGRVDVSDALQISQYSAGLLTSLRCRSGVLPARRRSVITTPSPGPTPTATLCSTNTECNYPNQVCANGLCQACYHDVQCNSGQKCMSGVCNWPRAPPRPTTILEACRDGLDNDNDGTIDHSSINSVNPDNNCQNANDNIEGNSFDQTVNRISYSNFDQRTKLPATNSYFSTQGISQSSTITFSYLYPTTNLPSGMMLTNGFQGIDYLASTNLLRRTNVVGSMTAINSVIYVGGNKVQRVRSRSGVIAGPDIYSITRDTTNRITSVPVLGISNVVYHVSSSRVDSLRVGTGGNAKDYTFTYNFFNKIRTMQIDNLGVSTTNTYDYSTDNRLIGANIGGSQISFVRFSDGRISHIDGSFGSIWFNYDSDKRITEIFNSRYEILSDPVVAKEIFSGSSFDVSILDMIWINKVCNTPGFMGGAISIYNIYRSQIAPSTEQARTVADLVCRNVR